MVAPIDLKNVTTNLVFTPNVIPTLGPTGLGAGGSVVPSQDHARPVHKLRLQLTGVVLQDLAANHYGSVLLGYLPDSNFIVLGSEANLAWTKDGTGIATGDTPKLAFGTAAASNAVLSSTMSNLLNGGAASGTAVASGLTGTWKYHSNANASAANVWMGASATLGVYMNISGTNTGDGTLTITGTLDLYVVDLGNANGI